MLKDYLLSLGCFIDNEYLDKYLELIEKPFVLSGYYEEHHVIPISIYKTSEQKCGIDRYKIAKQAEKDPNNKIIKLSYSDHVLAHWLLFNCTTGSLKKASAKAVIISCANNRDAINFSDQELLQFIKDVKKEKSFWSQTEIDKLVKAFNSTDGYLTDNDVLILSQELSRTPKAIRAKLVLLGLVKDMNYWSEEDIDWLKNNYAIHSVEFCAAKLNRSKNSIIGKACLLGLKNRKFWNDSEIEWLTLNYSLKDINECSQYLHKSKSVIYQQASALNLQSACRWTKEDENWLLANKASYSWEECAVFLSRSVASVKRKAFELGIKVDRCIKIRCIETGELFDSIKAASIKYGSHVVDVVNGKRACTRGLHFIKITE